MSAPDEQVKRGSISICGYGPSLGDTLDDLKRVVLTTSGAHDFLIARGVVPTYHVETDPRIHKAWMLTPHPSVHYLINSQCHPELFAKLDGYNVRMWHGCTDDDAERQIALVESLLPGQRLMNGGTNVGMRAMPVARELGFTSFDLHGFDCCYRGAQQWAGSHFGAAHKTVRVVVDGREFETSDLMLQSTDDFFNAMRMLSGCRFRVYGDGLLEARLKLYNRSPQRALSRGWFHFAGFRYRAA